MLSPEQRPTGNDDLYGTCATQIFIHSRAGHTTPGKPVRRRMPCCGRRFVEFGSGCRPCQLKVVASAYAIVIKPRQVRIANSAVLQEESRIARMTGVGTNYNAIGLRPIGSALTPAWKQPGCPIESHMRRKEVSNNWFPSTRTEHEPDLKRVPFPRLPFVRGKVTHSTADHIRPHPRCVSAHEARAMQPDRRRVCATDTRFWSTTFSTERTRTDVRMPVGVYKACAVLGLPWQTPLSSTTLYPPLHAYTPAHLLIIFWRTTHSVLHQAHLQS
ncbi:hypothetical protein C2E23DRAFT_341309 [Lenzites betulinus]|nr:hypothetical protein C2E23DRAFT_341309 [Lenzites betulinus]